MSRVFIFPYAGGSALSFSTWKKEFRNCELKVLEYPGRGVKAEEPFADSIQALARTLVEELLDMEICSDDILFGHSMGAVVCWHVAYELQEKNNIILRKIIISASRCPRSFSRDVGLELPNEKFVNKLIGEGHVVDEMLGSAYFWDNVLLIIRSDFELIQNYNAPKVQKKILTQGVLVIPTNDIQNCKSEMILWDDYFKDKCKKVKIMGNHFYFDDDSARKELCGIIDEVKGKIT